MKRFFYLLALLASASAHADWSYSEDTDAMTSKRTSYAQLQSDNSLNLGFPYKGKNHGNLTVRQHPKYGLNVIFTIDKGQLICRSYDGCSVMVRFDDKPAVRFGANGPADHSSDTIFISGASQFVASASKAKRILVQANVYQSGSPVLEFSSSTPLLWGAKSAAAKPMSKPKP
jgi:hypothetical protein